MVALSAVEPGVDVADGRVASTAGRAQTPRRNDLGSSLLDTGGESLFIPFLAYLGNSRLTLYGAVSKVREHSRRVVTPDAELFDVSELAPGLEAELAEGSVVVQPRHRSPIFLGHTFGEVGADETVGVGRVANNEDLAVLAGDLIEDFALVDKDLRVDFEKVGSLHARASGPGPDEKDDIRIGEPSLGAVCADDVLH